MASNIKQKKRILVIGNTGVGKSSIIRYMNAYDENDKLPLVKGGQRGVTFETILYQNDEFIFADTAGFGESAEGTVPSKQALEKLVEFLVNNIDGFSIILFVINNDRIDKNAVKTYHIMDAIIPSDIPKILVRTQDQAGAGNVISEEELVHWKLDGCFFCAGCRVSYPDMEELKAKKARETKIQECYQDIDLSNLIITKLINEHALRDLSPLYERGNLWYKIRKYLRVMVTLLRLDSLIISTTEHVIGEIIATKVQNELPEGFDAQSPNPLMLPINDAADITPVTGDTATSKAKEKKESTKNVNALSCSMCSQTFSTANNRDRHKQDVHKIDSTVLASLEDSSCRQRLFSFFRSHLLS